MEALIFASLLKKGMPDEKEGYHLNNYVLGCNKTLIDKSAGTCICVVDLRDNITV